MMCQIGPNKNDGRNFKSTARLHYIFKIVIANKARKYTGRFFALLCGLLIVGSYFS